MRRDWNFLLFLVLFTVLSFPFSRTGGAADPSLDWIDSISDDYFVNFVGYPTKNPFLPNGSGTGPYRLFPSLFSGTSADLSERGEDSGSESFLSSPLFSGNVTGNEIIRGNFSHLKIAPFSFRVVGTTFGEWDDFSGSGKDLSGGFQSSVYGMTLGADRLFGENILIGAHAIAGQVDIDPENADYRGGITAVGGVARMGLFGPLWYWDLSLGGSGNRNRATYPRDGVSVREKKNVTQMNYQTELGLKIKSGFTRVEPFLGFRYIYLSDGGVDLTPSQSLFPTIEKEGLHSYRTLLGSRFLWEYAGYIATYRPFLQGFWVHEFGDETVWTASDAFLYPIAGEYGGFSFPKDRAVIGVGVSAALRDMVDLFINYNSSFAQDYLTYSLFGGFNVKY